MRTICGILCPQVVLHCLWWCQEIIVKSQTKNDCRSFADRIILQPVITWIGEVKGSELCSRSFSFIGEKVCRLCLRDRLSDLSRDLQRMSYNRSGLSAASIQAVPPCTGFYILCLIWPDSGNFILIVLSSKRVVSLLISLPPALMIFIPVEKDSSGQSTCYMICRSWIRVWPPGCLQHQYGPKPAYYRSKCTPKLIGATNPGRPGTWAFEL